MRTGERGMGCGGCGEPSAPFAVWVRTRQGEGAAGVQLCPRCFGTLEATIGWGSRDGRAAASLVAGYAMSELEP